MQAIRTIQSVEGGKLNISLPPDYQHTRVEVIILPFPEAGFEPQGKPSQDWKQDFLSISRWDQDDAASEIY
ncbi:MAG: hypothetical protein EA399_14920 [Desulfovibrionales bacterium]|nr:MAG: hypothetical protein EA399_14920 [Desulfovibrionales bacterium]